MKEDRKETTERGLKLVCFFFSLDLSSNDQQLLSSPISPEMLSRSSRFIVHRSEFSFCRRHSSSFSKLTRLSLFRCSTSNLLQSAGIHSILGDFTDLELIEKTSSEVDIVLLLAKAEVIEFAQAVGRGLMKRVRDGKTGGRKPCVIRLSGAESFVRESGVRAEGERLSVSSNESFSTRLEGGELTSFVFAFHRIFPGRSSPTGSAGIILWL